MEYIETASPDTEIESEEYDTENTNENIGDIEGDTEATETEEKCDTPPVLSEEAEKTTENILEADLDELASEFPEISCLGDVSKMENAIRYGELRALGLSPREAYLATRKTPQSKFSARSHLTPATPCAARRVGVSIPRAELKIARELFEGLSDSEIETLYKKVMRT